MPTDGRSCGDLQRLEGVRRGAGRAQVAARSYTTCGKGDLPAGCRDLDCNQRPLHASIGPQMTLRTRDQNGHAKPAGSARYLE